MQTNGAYLHLVLNHLPMLLPMVGVVILAIGAALKLHQTKVVGIAVIVVGACTAAPTYFTGSVAKDVVQNYPIVTTISLEKHEQAALYSFIAIEIAGGLGLVLLWQSTKQKKIHQKSMVALIVLTLFAFLLLIQTAHLGGLIRHEEIERGSF